MLFKHHHHQQVGLVAFFLYPIRAIVRENAALLLVHLLVCVIQCAGIIWYLCTRFSVQPDTFKLVTVSCMLPITIIIMVR